MKKIVCLTAVLLLLFSFRLPAQDTVQQPVYSEADYNAAYELFTAIGMPKLMEDAITLMTDLQIKNAPMLQQTKVPMLNFFRKYMSYEAMKKDYAELYLKNFTVAELKELTVFYQTPIGKKLAQKQSTLMQEGAKLGEQRVQSNISELQSMIREELQKQLPQR